MKTTLLLAMLAIAGSALLAPTASALNCTQHVDVDHEVDTSDGIRVTASAWTDPEALVRCETQGLPVIRL